MTTGHPARVHLVWNRVRAIRRDDHGSAAAELTLLTPVLILLLLFVVYCGRAVDTTLRITDAAHQAARAATLARTPTQATTNAHTTASTALASAGITCQSLSVSTDTHGLTPGSTVTVTVTCRVGLADLAILGVPGSQTFTSSSTSPVDVWRGTSTPAGDAP